jgi:hypothetical protein
MGFISLGSLPGHLGHCHHLPERHDGICWLTLCLRTLQLQWLVTTEHHQQTAPAFKPNSPQAWADCLSTNSLFALIKRYSACSHSYYPEDIELIIAHIGVIPGMAIGWNR